MTRSSYRHLTQTFGALAFAVCSVSCASTGFVPRPFPVPGGAPTPTTSTPTPPPAPASNPASGLPSRGGFDGYALAGTALSFRGAPYRNGGVDPNQGFDCSGFTQYVFAQHGISLPREVREQYRSGISVKAAELVAGDLIFFTTTDPGASHVAIAIGGDEFVHAPSSLGVVRVEHIGSSYWSQRYLGARRVN